MVNKIKIRLSILILSLITIISIMTISISGEVKKISAASEDYKDKLIRFHVIANSDSEEDQNLKLKLRDAIINYLQPKLLESESIEESELIVLPAGEYKALRIIIGEGKGKNWWCVMFPPLCFVDEQKGIIDKETDDKLREVLTEEEYELISQKTSKQVDRVQIKFKIVEIIQDIIK